MSIIRSGTTHRWSDYVIHNNTLYVVEVASEVTASFAAQTADIFKSLEQTLLRAGSSKEKLLMATIYLKDLTNLTEFNSLWDTWIPRGCAPVRACVAAQLANPAYLVEIQLIAAVAG